MQPNQEKVVAEKNKTIAKLDDGISGTCFISTKAKLPNNIQAMDQETWNEIGVLLKELMKKMEEKDVCHNFTFKAWLGEESILKWEESKTFSVLIIIANLNFWLDYFLDINYKDDDCQMKQDQMIIKFQKPWKMKGLI